jgi:hypothetical protein
MSAVSVAGPSAGHAAEVTFHEKRRTEKSVRLFDSRSEEKVKSQACFASWKFRVSRLFPLLNHPMHDATAIHGHDIIGLVSIHPNGKNDP